MRQEVKSMCNSVVNVHNKENICEYDQEMSQSLTTHQPMAPWGRDTEQLQPHDSKKTIKVKQKVSMISKYHNHTQQTNPRYLEEEPQNTNSHKTPGRQLKQSNQLSLPRQDDRKTRNDTGKCITKQRPTKSPHNQCEEHKTMNQRYNINTAFERTTA